MLILAFACFFGLIAGWLFAPSAAPGTTPEPASALTLPEPGSIPA